MEDQMRRVALFSIVPAFLLFFAGPLQAQGVTGTWELTYSTAGRGGETMTRTMTVNLVQEEAAVTGTVTLAAMGGRRGGGGGNPPAPQEIAIENGTMEGDSLTFSYTMGMGDRSFTQTFKAKVTGDTMEGTMSGAMRQMEPVPFKGVKKEG
jgi:hypothetical protein